MLRLWSVITVVLGVFANVGGAAEPAVKHENIEWAQVWIPDNARTDLPRVLLIGDSICNAYYDGVAQTLKDKARTLNCLHPFMNWAWCCLCTALD